MCQRSKGHLEMRPKQGNQGDPQTRAGQVWTRMWASQGAHERLASGSKANKTALQNKPTREAKSSETGILLEGWKSSDLAKDDSFIHLFIHSVTHFHHLFNHPSIHLFVLTSDHLCTKKKFQNACPGYGHTGDIGIYATHALTHSFHSFNHLFLQPSVC